MTEDLKSKFSKPLCLFWLPTVVWHNTTSEQHVRLAVLKINAKKHLDSIMGIPLDGHIQIVFNAFIVMMLELGVDGAIRCSAGRGA